MKRSATLLTAAAVLVGPLVVMATGRLLEEATGVPLGRPPGNRAFVLPDPAWLRAALFLCACVVGALATWIIARSSTPVAVVVTSVFLLALVSDEGMGELQARVLYAVDVLAVGAGAWLLARRRYTRETDRHRNGLA